MCSQVTLVQGPHFKNHGFSYIEILSVTRKFHTLFYLCTCTRAHMREQKLHNPLIPSLTSPFIPTIFGVKFYSTLKFSLIYHFFLKAFLNAKVFGFVFLCSLKHHTKPCIAILFNFLNLLLAFGKAGNKFIL